MDLSVIIPVYNAAALLDRCLDSVFNQKTRYTYEVILVDDGSTDNSVELIKARNEKNIILYKQQNAVLPPHGIKAWNWHRESMWLFLMRMTIGKTGISRKLSDSWMNIRNVWL